MSGHADIIRRALDDFDLEVPQGRDATLSTDALAALDALEAENQQLRDVGGRALVALEELSNPKYGEAAKLARAALGDHRPPA